ncbi:MAG: hypothetical protein KAI43_07535 [Candidatus Aureabacteria bacterium]|nr:hypothetical protein [Candidatus Auribacterota bacterium]
MNKGGMLSKIEKLGCIYKTPCGIINVNIRGMTLHLSEYTFTDFSLMVSKASTVLLDQGLTEIMKERECGK